MSASVEDGSIILQAAIAAFALRNRMTENQLASTVAAISPVPVISAAAVNRLTFFSITARCDANLASLRNFSHHCCMMPLKMTRLKKKMKILCLPRLSHSSDTAQFPPLRFSEVFQNGYRTLCTSIRKLALLTPFYRNIRNFEYNSISPVQCQWLIYSNSPVNLRGQV
jgi:hypothetical protein